MVDIYEHDVQNKISASDYKVRYMTPEETLEKLKDKLLEESQEVFEAYGLEDKTNLRLALKKYWPFVMQSVQRKGALKKAFSSKALITLMKRHDREYARTR